MVRLRNLGPFNAIVLQVQKPGLRYAASERLGAGRAADFVACVSKDIELLSLNRVLTHESLPLVRVRQPLWQL